MKTLQERRDLRRKWFVKSDKKRTIWDRAKDYVTFSIAVAAFGTSLFTLYISHYGGPQDFRVTTYLPRLAQITSSVDIHDIQWSMFSHDKLAEEEGVPDDKAKSFKLNIDENLVFINAGSSPVLVSSISILTPFNIDVFDKGLSDLLEETTHISCRYKTFHSIKWTAEPFVVLPGAIAQQHISFVPYRTKNRVNADFCFRFVIVDRSGKEQIFDTSQFSVDFQADGHYTRLTSSSDVKIWASRLLQFTDETAKKENRQTTVLLKSYF